MDRGSFLNSKKLVKNATILMVCFIVIALISSSSLSIELIDKSERNNFDFENDAEEATLLEESLTGLDPKSLLNNPIITKASTDIHHMKADTIINSVPLMYGYIVYGGTSGEPEGPCYNPVDNPGNITSLSPTSSGDFIAGGTWTCDETWFGCENGSGDLWVIDPYNGDMTCIGGGGKSCNGLAWDPVYNRLYATSGTGLYEYDPETGEQEYIGSHGVGNTMIAMAINLQGICYTWDVVSNGSSTLFTVDLETGDATEVGSMGQNLCYAQDGFFHWETNKLFLTAYSTSGFLATCNLKTGELTTIGDFEGGAEITASMFESCCMCGYHDVGVYDILSPKDGGAAEEIEVTIGVKNYGLRTAEDIQVDVVILKNGSDEEYNETGYIDKLSYGEEIDLEMPIWTPDDWQKESNGYINYNITAYTSLWEDINPENDKKEKMFELYFGYIHDIEITCISSPCEDGPGKTYPVQATITNIGQNTECCIPIDIKIVELSVQETLLTEVDWDTVPPEGWYDEHKNFSESYGWDKSYTSYSGGDRPEAKLQYTKAKSDHVFYSYAIDTSDYSSCQFEFLSYINHYSGSGLYSIEAGYSYDAKNWYAAWHEEPDSSGSYEVSVTIEGGFETTYIGFWVKGEPYYFNYWYIDDVSLKVFDIVSEYSDYACQGDYIEPGESKTFEFDDWTPNFLQYETTGSKDYIVQAEINMVGDKNPSNDIISKNFTLDYWHDAGIHEVTSPPNHGYDHGELCWDNGEPDGRNRLICSMYQGYSNIIIDDCELFDSITAIGGHFRFVWDSGNSVGNLETVRVYFFEETGNCEPSEDEYAEVEVTYFEEYATGDFYFGRPEIAVDVEFDEVFLESGTWWIGFQPDGIEEDIAYMLTAEGFGCAVMADLPYWEYPRWSSSNDIWDKEYDFSWRLSCYWGGCPAYYPISPGIKDINVTVKNYGTFPELDLTCDAQIWEYITDPENATLVYEDNITDIDLDMPLGGELYLMFDEYNFEYEGIYHLYLDMPDENDDFPNNNIESLRLGVDTTGPISTYELDPPNPDGENGWYANDVEVTLQAYDPLSNDVSSGVKEIKYRVNGGPVETIDGGWGYFLLTQEDDGDDVLVEYWAIDNVGNEETSHNIFTIDMDQTAPTVELTYEVVSGNPVQGWLLEFGATATDEISGVDYVEFYLNEILQKTINGSGPTFTWSFIYHGGMNITIKVIAYDKAGNNATKIIENPKPTSYNYNNQNSQYQSEIYKISNIIKNPPQKFFLQGWFN